MSQINTVRYFFVFLFGIMITCTAHAKLSIEVARTSMQKCVEDGLRAEGINPLMQNRWNVNSYVGKIQLEITKICNDRLASIENAQEEQKAIENQNQPEDEAGITAI